MIEVKNLSMRYGPTLAVNDVSFKVQKGEILGLLGPNGAGKTTTMRILMTYLAPTAGTALLGGFDILEKPLDVRRITGYLPETAPLYMDREVCEYLAYVGRARGLDRKTLKERLEWVVENCALREVYRKPVNELSRGYRQRTGLAQALIHDPQILILDEPTSGLDPIQILGIRDLIRKLARDKTIIFSTHILQEVEAISDRVVIINEGDVIAEGTADDLRGRAADGDVVLVRFEEAAGAEEALRALPGVGDVRRRDGGFLVRAPKASGVLASVDRLARERGWALRELRRETPSLEDAFIALTKSKKS